jgi:hypothetical protein
MLIKKTEHPCWDKGTEHMQVGTSMFASKQTSLAFYSYIIQPGE